MRFNDQEDLRKFLEDLGELYVPYCAGLWDLGPVRSTEDLAVAPEADLQRCGVQSGIHIARIKAAASGASSGSGQAGAGGGAGAAEEPYMTAFLASLQSLKPPKVDAQSTSKFLHLCSAYFPDDDTWQRNCLLIRDCYPKLLDEVKSNRIMLVTGTPGIGKSWWIWYVIWRLQHDGPQPSHIVWETHAYLQRRVLFSGGKALVGDQNSFKEELRDANAWYVTDGVIPRPAAARTIMVASPKRDVYKDFLKRTSVRLIMPVWSKDELDRCRGRLYSEFKQERLDGLYAKYGGVPRNTLELPSQAQEVEDLVQLEDALSTCNYQQILASVRNHDTAPESSHRLLHLEPGDTFRLQSVNVASRYVAERIMDMACHNSEVSTRTLLAALRGNTVWSSFRGSLFEQLAHSLLPKGGEFPLKVLANAAASSISTAGPAVTVSDGEYHLNMSRCERRSFAASELADMARAWSSTTPDLPLYLVPVLASYPGIDSIVLPNCLFQMTIQQQRTFDAGKVLTSLNLLPDLDEYFFFYVVPRSLRDFKVPNLTNLQGRAARLKFFELAIKDEDDDVVEGGRAKKKRK